jgi:NitT/TauT family transport system permease protein
MRLTAYRVAVVVGLVLLVEALCLAGIIDRITMQPPHQIARDLWKMLASGSMNAAMRKTFGNAALAFAMALSAGIAFAALLHGYRRVRATLDPLFATYYAVPVFAFYPALIVVFGFGDIPQILIGFMLAVVAVVVNTLNGLDRVPRVLEKTARVQRFGRLRTAITMTLPSAAPYILTGVKLAVAYSLIGVVGSEFIMSRGGVGYEISFAYTNFDNETMYPLIVLVLGISIAVNGALSHWEKRLLARRGLR